MNSDSNTIPTFFDGRSVFVTGATGFLGKVLLEKLLRSCPGIKNIYILLREKRGKVLRQRLQELVSCKVFDRLKTEFPDALQKVIPVAGNLSLPQLGISPEDIAMMAESVSVVFHSAATVKFQEPLTEAVDVNVLATRRMIELSHQLPNLVSLVYVSTAYANCNRKDIEEVLYPAPFPPSKIIEATKWMGPSLLESITPSLIGDRPNTYTFTKALAENLLVEECGTLPVAIVRPSIVTASWKEPFPGWIDNLNGASGLVVLEAKGLLRTMLVKNEVVCDAIPVDVVINLLISVAWFTATKKPNGIMIYNCTSGSYNKTTYEDIMKVSCSASLKYPSAELLRYPKYSSRRNQYFNKICTVFQHYLPALFYDSLAYAFFRKPGMMRAYEKVNKMVHCLEYFTTNEWNFHCDNVFMVKDALTPEDQETFFVDIRKLDWLKFWENHVLGCRKFILKEDPSTIPAARKNLKRMFFISLFIRILMVIFVWQIFFSHLFSKDIVWNAISSASQMFQNALKDN